MPPLQDFSSESFLTDQLFGVLSSWVMTIDLISATATSQAIDDSNIAFMGLWSYVADSTGTSMHVSNSAGDTAETTFLGK